MTDLISDDRHGSCVSLHNSCCYHPGGISPCSPRRGDTSYRALRWSATPASSADLERADKQREAAVLEPGQPDLCAGLGDGHWPMIDQKKSSQCGGHPGVAEHRRPFSKCQVGADNDRGLLVEAADQMEQQLAASLGERQIAEFTQLCSRECRVLDYFLVAADLHSYSSSHFSAPAGRAPPETAVRSADSGAKYLKPTDHVSFDQFSGPHPDARRMNAFCGLLDRQPFVRRPRRSCAVSRRRQHFSSVA